MRLILMSTLLLTLSAGAGRASENDPVTLKLRPVAEVGPQVIATKGPEGEPAVEFVGGPQQSTITLLAFDAPENTPANFVLRGKMKATAIDGKTLVNAKSMFLLRSEIVTDTGSRPETSIGIISDGDWHEFKIHSLHNYPRQAVAKLKRFELDLSVWDDCKLTLDQSLVLEPMVKSGEQWVAQEPIATLALRSPAELTPRISMVPGPNDEPAIEVAAGPKGGTYALAVKDLPRISSPDYVLRGRVKYAHVAGDGYLELLNDFADRGTFFTRSLAESGPLGKLNGTSDWREFELPFHAQPGMVPKSLTLNIVLAGTGTVTVAEPLSVIQLNLSSAWCSPMQIVGIGLTLCALIVILGCSACLLAAWGRSRRLAVSLLGVALAISAASLIAGIVALCADQPWPIYFQLLLQGSIGLLVWGINVPNIVRYFRANELRRMSAADVV